MRRDAVGRHRKMAARNPLGSLAKDPLHKGEAEADRGQEFAMQHYSTRNLGDVCRRLSSMAECMRFEQVLRQRRVAGTFNGLTFYFADFQLQLDPNAFDCQGPIPSTSSVAHYLHLHSQDVPHGGIVLLNRAHLAEEARDPLGTWPLEMLTVMR